MSWQRGEGAILRENVMVRRALQKNNLTSRRFFWAPVVDGLVHGDHFRAGIVGSIIKVPLITMSQGGVHLQVKTIWQQQTPLAGREARSSVRELGISLLLCGIKNFMEEKFNLI